MDPSRRVFFEQVVAAGGLAALSADLALADKSGRTKSPSENFWNSFYQDSDPGNQGRGVESGVSRLIAPHRNVTYLYQGNAQQIRFAHDVDKNELLDYEGDVAVSVNIGQMRPSQDDHKAIRENKSFSLRVDCTQTRSFMNVISPMAWCALAAVYTDSAGKLPSLESLGWQNDASLSGQNRIVLPAGMGKFAVNVSLVHKESMIHKVLKQAVTTGSSVSGLFGLPGLSIQALKVVTDIYSYLEERASFVLNSVPTDVAATRQAIDQEEMSDRYIPLVSGTYILIPAEHADRLGDKLSRYQLRQGYFLETDKIGGRDLPIEALRDQASPDVTYITMKVTVTKVAAGSQDAGTAKAKSSDDAAAGSDSTDSPGSAGSSSKKPAAAGAKPKAPAKK